MNFAIDFSIFESPGRSFGVVAGEIDLPKAPAVNEVIDVAQCDRQADLPPALRGLKVLGVSEHKVNGVYKIVFEDVMVESRQAASELATTLETKFGLFCWRLHDD